MILPHTLHMKKNPTILKMVAATLVTDEQTAEALLKN
jgi:hypothetical protein